jgi:hypothetical protein
MPKYTQKQKRMIAIVRRYKKYVGTYDTQTRYIDYSDETFLADMLYGIGISFNPKVYMFSNGFLLFKEKIKAYFETGKLD